MQAIYYSLVLTSRSLVYQTQWRRSIESLRRYNRDIPVFLFLFNDAPPEILKKAEECNVVVHNLGSYRDCLMELAGEEGAVLSAIPTLNKLLPLPRIDSRISQLLYLDCDTYFFGDVARLFADHRECRLYAREEQNSRKSPFFRYRKEYVDEDALACIAAETGATFVPPCNSGVFLLNHGLAAELSALRAEFLRYAWRLTLGGATMSRDLNIPPAVREYIAGLPPAQLIKGLPFPSNIFWLIEEIAFWLTLGRIPGLTHGQFPLADVLQNGEFRIYRSYRSKSILIHYFRTNEARFLMDAGILPEPAPAMPDTPGDQPPENSAD
jgi:hypothetical protein